MIDNHVKLAFLVLSVFFSLAVVTPSTFAQQADDTNLISESQAERIASILRNDVLKSFDLESTYDTDLKKKRFLDSPDGKRLRDSLAILRQQTLLQLYDIQLKENASEYDLKKKGFLFALDQHSLYGWSTPEATEEGYQEYKSGGNVLKGISFPSVPLKPSRGGILGLTAAKLLFIPYKESIAEQMENKDVTLRFVFGLNGNTKRIKKLSVFSYEDYYFPIAKNVKLQCMLDGEVLIEIKYK